MIIGVPKEIKNNESRVGMTPGTVVSFRNAGHEVLVQSGQALGSDLRMKLIERLEPRWLLRLPKRGKPRWL